MEGLKFPLNYTRQLLEYCWLPGQAESTNYLQKYLPALFMQSRFIVQAFHQSSIKFDFWGWDF